MKFQRRILPPHSSTYLEMEEYRPDPPPTTTDRFDSSSDLSEIESVCSLATNVRQRSDSLNNLFHLAEDNTSVSNLSLASASHSQRSMDNNSPTVQSSLSFYSDKSSRTRRSITSLNSQSQKSFSIKTTDTSLTTRAIHPLSSDKCGLIANDGNNLDQPDDLQPDDDDDVHSEVFDDQDLEIITSQSNRRLRKTVLNNVDRFLTSANKQIKL